MPRLVRALTPADLQPPEGCDVLIFDWDGTLFLNHHFNFEVMQWALAQVGVPITEEWFAENSGYSARAMLQLALDAAGSAADADEVLARRNEYADSRIGDVPPFEPVLALLKNAAPRRAAVVTGSPRASIDALLARHDLLPHLSAIVTRNELERGKPHPDGYLLALARLGAAPEQAVVYEDSEVGIEAAHAAGIDVIDVRGVAVDPTP